MKAPPQVALPRNAFAGNIKTSRRRGRAGWAALLATALLLSACGRSGVERDVGIDGDTTRDAERDAAGDVGDTSDAVSPDTHRDAEPDVPPTPDTSRDAEDATLPDTRDDAEDGSPFCGARPPNACGGCEALDAEPGTECGPCGGGRFACVGTDAVRCEGADECDALRPSAGDFHTCVIRPDSAGIPGLLCWGRNDVGQLGLGDFELRARPVRVALAAPPQSVALARRHTCAAVDGARLFCWGGNERGQLGTGTEIERVPEPVSVEGEFELVAAGLRHTCAVQPSGNLSCWGSNRGRQLGNPDTGDRQTPIRVPGIAEVIDLALGSSHTCVLSELQGVVCFGASARTEEPVLPEPQSIASGDEHLCGRAFDGTVFCWGANGTGQLGTGDTEWRDQPTVVALPAPAVDVATGFRHTCAALVDGTVWCWGDNREGQLGDGTRDTRTLPGPVPDIEGAVGVAGGSGHSCAALRDGTMWCWGANGSGQLGNGTTETSLVPVAVRLP